MCKYCEQISDDIDLPKWQVHAIIDRFVKLREADGIFALEISPECKDPLKWEDIKHYYEEDEGKEGEG